MRALFSLIIGGLTAVAGIFLHLLYPPFGLLLALVGTFTSLWSLGRYFGKRRYKVWAAGGWIFIFFKGALFGAGSEILVQGDNLGIAFTVFGFITIALATIWKN